MPFNIGAVGSPSGAINLNGTTSGSITITVSAVAGSWTMTLPAIAGTQGGFLSTNGSGVMKWSTGFSGTEYGLIGPGPIAGSGVLPGLNVGLNTTTYITCSDGTGTVYMSGGSPSIFGTFTNHDLVIRTNNVTRMTISNAGAMRWHAYGAGTLTTDASGNITATSDERLKRGLKRFKAGLRELLQLKPILYHWKKSSMLDTEHEYAGFSAQNVQMAIPEATGINLDGTLTIQDRALIATVVNAIQELQKRIEILEKKS